MPALAERFTVLAPDLLGQGAVGQTPWRLLARRPRQHAARPDGRARARASHGRRPVARGRRGHAVRVSVPGALRAPGPGGQRRTGPGGHVLPPDADRARIRVGLSALLHAAAARRREPGRHVARPRGRAIHARQPGDLAELRVAGGRREPPRILSQPARRDRLQRAGGERPRSAVPGSAVADIDRVGCARPVHSGEPRASRRTRPFPAAASRSSRGWDTTRTARPPSGSSRCSSTSSPLRSPPACRRGQRGARLRVID